MESAPKRQLTIFDSTCIFVGIIIGAGVYQMAPSIASGINGLSGELHELVGIFSLTVWRWICLLGLWLAGGVVSLFGAIGYAELASAWPQSGGDYVYLTRAYGKWAGFMFGWIQLAIVRPGDITVMAFAFALYFRQVFNPFGSMDTARVEQIYSVAAVLVFTIINIIGVKQGKLVQNILTSVKAIGLVAIIIAAAFSPASVGQIAEPFEGGIPIVLAFVFILFTFGGWNEMAFVAAEVKDPSRNIVRALVAGISAVTVLYIMVNAAFMYSLGYAGLAGSEAVATDCIAEVTPKYGAGLISGLICISALGAVNGLVFTGARITYAMGTDHRLFKWFGHWNQKTQTPVTALVIQGIIAVSLIIFLGSFVDAIIYTAAAVYLFYLATSISVFVLRRKEPDVERPYRVTGYPVPVIIFSVVCCYLIYSCLSYGWNFKRDAMIVMICAFCAGIVIYIVDRVLKSGHEDSRI